MWWKELGHNLVHIIMIHSGMMAMGVVMIMMLTRPMTQVCAGAQQLRGRGPEGRGQHLRRLLIGPSPLVIG